MGEWLINRMDRIGLEKKLFKVMLFFYLNQNVPIYTEQTYAFRQLKSNLSQVQKIANDEAVSER